LCPLFGLGAAPGTEPGASEQKVDQTIENLKGEDAGKGAIAADNLLMEIVEKKSPRSREYLDFFRKALDPEGIPLDGPELRVPKRLIVALAYKAASRQPYPPEGPDLLLKLIQDGVGPESFRKVVREALATIARAEIKKDGRSRIADVLVALVQQNSSPSPIILNEVSSILWQVDGKDLLNQLIGVLSRKKASSGKEIGPYILQLRQILGINFSTIEEWERWWTENRESPIEVILEKVNIQMRGRQIELWQKNMERIKEALDPESYLGAINDSLELNPTPELQEAVAVALGGFPDWLRESKFTQKSNGTPVMEDSKKAAYTSRALALLLNLLEADSKTITPTGVKRKALVSLRKYAQHLAKNPQDEGAVVTLLDSGFRTFFPDGVDGNPLPHAVRSAARADILELIRATGSLQTPALKPYLKKILREEKTRGFSDRELIKESIAALGRMMERGVERESVELIMEYFRINPEPDKQDIRKTCVTALNLPIEDASLRGDVRQFYNEVLASSGDKTGRVPAILGLGILARAGDVEAIKSLEGVISPSRRMQFDPTEATAAVDAIAYLGGRQALELLLPYLDSKDQPFAGHVWRKVVSNLKGKDLKLLEWTLSWILDRSFLGDQTELAGILIRLMEEQELAPLFTPEKAKAASPEEFISYWEVIRSKAKALELVGNEEGAAAALAMLHDLAVKNGRMNHLRPGAREELVKEQLLLKRLGEVKAALAKTPPLEPEAQAKELLSVLDPGEKGVDRWRRLHWVMIQLQGLKPSPEAVLVVEQLRAKLSSPEGKAIWKEIPPETPPRYLKSLEILREKLITPPPEEK